MANGMMAMESAHMMESSHGRVMQLAGGLRTAKAGILQLSGRRSMVSGITSMQPVIWLQMNGMMDAGSAQAVHGSMKASVHGEVMQPAGGLRILQAGGLQNAGRRSMVSGITLEVMDIWLQASILMVTG